MKDGVMQSVTFVDGHCNTPSPESITKPVVRPEAYRDKIVWVAMYMACTCNVSNMV